MAYQVNPALLQKLPRTFVPALNEQILNWDVLFPAERRAIGAQMGWLERLPDAQFKALFDPILVLEKQMDLPAWSPATDRLSVTDTGILVRSPHYQQWRTEVERAFEKIDAGIEASGAVKRSNKLVVSVMPPGVPTPAGHLWPKREAEGKWLPLAAPLGSILPDFYRGIATRETAAAIEPLERTWVFEYDPTLASTRVPAPVVALSFDQIGPLRREFLVRLNYVKRDLRTLDHTYDDLRRLDLKRLYAEQPEVEVREFVRNLFLSGNGALLFGNSFVQWGASEAFRRAAPQATFCRFGIRPKIKPFSGVVLFEDQNRANPVPDKPDPEGSLIDAKLLMEYVYLSALRSSDYMDRTLTIFAIPEQARLLALGPAAAISALTRGGPPAAVGDLIAGARSWLAGGTGA